MLFTINKTRYNPENNITRLKPLIWAQPTLMQLFVPEVTFRWRAQITRVIKTKAKVKAKAKQCCEVVFHRYTMKWVPTDASGVAKRFVEYRDIRYRYDVPSIALSPLMETPFLQSNSRFLSNAKDHLSFSIAWVKRFSRARGNFCSCATALNSGCTCSVPDVNFFHYESRFGTT